MTNPSLPTAAPILISSLLAACGTTGTKDSILPTDLKPMSQIYKEHFARGKAPSERAPAPHDMTLPKRHDTQLYGTLRIAASALDHTFPRLANPTLVMTIYPHLAGSSGAPVPGYATYFTLYEQTEYAQPGEFITPVHPAAPIHPADSETLEAEFAAGATP